MHIGINGASGFLGPRLASHLAAVGYTGVGVSRRGVKELPEGWTWKSRTSVLDSVEPHFPPLDWLIHLEVKQHVYTPSELDVDEFERVNVDCLQQWLDWCDRSNVTRVVYFSTIKAVGESTKMQDEETQSVPSTLYGQSKRKAEKLIGAWTAERAERRALILRPAVIYGPGNQANVFSMVRAIDRGVFFLVGQNENVKSLVSVANVVSAVQHLMQRAEPGVAVYNVVDRTSYSVREIADMIAAHLGRSGRVHSLPLGLARLGAEVGDAFRRVTGRSLPLTRSRLRALTETTHFDGTKLLNTGFIHPQSTEEGLREMVEWYRKTYPR